MAWAMNSEILITSISCSFHQKKKIYVHEFIIIHPVLSNICQVIEKLQFDKVLMKMDPFKYNFACLILRKLCIDWFWLYIFQTVFFLYHLVASLEGQLSAFTYSMIFVSLDVSVLLVYIDYAVMAFKAAFSYTYLTRLEHIHLLTVLSPPNLFCLL